MSKTKMLRPAWTPLTITLMVVGFILFWPLGLAMLGYILFGDQLQLMWEEKSGLFSLFDQDNGHQDAHPWQASRRAQRASGNVAFDDFRASELARLAEERRKLDAMRDDFDAYQRDLNRARDQEEFDRFLRDRQSAKTNESKAQDLEREKLQQPAATPAVPGS